MAAKKGEAAPTSAAGEEEVRYDLTSKITPFLDKHLIFPILHFIKELNVYDQKDIARAELHLLNDTFMLDFALDKYDELGEEKPESLTNKRQDVIDQLATARDQELGLLQILEDEDSVKKMHGCKSITEVCDQFDVTIEQVEGLVTYAKLQFECGNYSLSSELLKHYRGMMDKDSERVMTSKSVSCIWGSIASLLLNREFEDAVDNIATLNDFLENAKLGKREVLLQRTWLVHWSLFAIFRSDTVPVKALDIFLHEKSLSIISISCPHVFRYVSACLILHKRLRLALKETVWIIQLESGAYSDPITRFLVALYTDLDFDLAQQELQECKKVCEQDFFLAHHWEDFEENARLLIFETYCRIHQCINIDMIATKLNMTPGEAELWIVKLIQNAKLDARIDSEKSRVVMSKAPPSVYHQVIEKTKNLSFRSTMLLSNLEKRENEKKGVMF
jgi:translation initiation factor 3 subunit E